MSYKTILVHIEDVPNIEARIQTAINLAKRENAHLIGISPSNVSSFIYDAASYGATEPALTSYLEPLRKKAEESLNKFKSMVQQAGISLFEAHLTDNDAETAIGEQAPYADLLVLGQYDPAVTGGTSAVTQPENIVLRSGGPALVIPHTGLKQDLGNRVLVAWNASNEAKRALRDALPFLQQATAVDVAIFEEPGRTTSIEEHLLTFLSRHRINANVIKNKAEQDIGRSLLALAAERNSDLLVMGCYGHSRLREILLGGVTHTVMRSMTLPVFMSH